MEDLSYKFNHLFKIISSSHFLDKRINRGDIPFYITSYDPKQELDVRESIRMLRNRLEAQGIPILEINLYDLVCKILEAKGGVSRMFQVEKNRNKSKFLRALQSSLNIHEVLMPEIDSVIKSSNSKVYFLTGIGLVFPFIRSHNILNNLQSIAKECPTICFFPGEYTGQSLNLFGLLKDDNYYRAFNIDKIEVR